MTTLPTMKAELLRAIRDEMQLTQAEMAKKFGVDIRSYRRWENNERPMPGPAVILSQYLLREFRNIAAKS